MNVATAAAAEHSVSHALKIQPLILEANRIMKTLNINLWAEPERLPAEHSKEIEEQRYLKSV